MSALVVVAAAVGAAHISQAGQAVTRTPTWATRPSASRLIAEAGLLVICLGAILLARRRGAPALPRDVDPLLASVPWLLGIVASLIAVHLAGPLVRWLAARLSKRQGAVGFLGLARASRSGTGTRLVTVAVVTTVATTLFTATVAGAVGRGQEQASWEQVYADARVDDISAAPAAVERVRGLPGVDAVAEVFVEEAARISTVQYANATLVAVQPIDLARIVSGSPLAGLPALAASTEDPLPPAVINSAASDLGDSDTVTISTPDGVMEARIAQVVTTLPFVDDPREPVVVVPFDALPEADRRLEPANQLLLRGTFGPEQVASLQTVVGGDMTLRADVLDSLRDSGFSRLLTRAFMATTVGAMVYALLAIVIWLVVTAAARGAFLSVLRTLGLTTRQAGRLVSVELAPTVLVAVLTGGLCGWALTWLAAPALDLRQLTAGIATPLGTQPWVAMALTLSAALITLLAVVAVVGYQRRRSPTDVLRLGGET